MINTYIYMYYIHVEMFSYEFYILPINSIIFDGLIKLNSYQMGHNHNVISWENTKNKIIADHHLFCIFTWDYI